MLANFPDSALYSAFYSSIWSHAFKRVQTALCSSLCGPHTKGYWFALVKTPFSAENSGGVIRKGLYLVCDTFVMSNVWVTCWVYMYSFIHYCGQPAIASAKYYVASGEREIDYHTFYFSISLWPVLQNTQFTAERNWSRQKNQFLRNDVFNCHLAISTRPVVKRRPRKLQKGSCQGNTLALDEIASASSKKQKRKKQVSCTWR